MNPREWIVFSFFVILGWTLAFAVLGNGRWDYIIYAALGSTIGVGTVLGAEFLFNRIRGE